MLGFWAVPFIRPMCSYVAIHISGFVGQIYGNVNAATFYDSLTMVFEGGSSFFRRGGGPITERGGPNWRIPKGNTQSYGGPEHFINFDCKWCILNQFIPPTKS